MMTESARKSAIARESVDWVTADLSEPFAFAQSVLDDAHQALARLDLLQPARDQASSLAVMRQELSDQIDEKLWAETWRLVGLQATSLGDIATKVRYVQEVTQVDDADIETQITLSLCRDLTALIRGANQQSRDRVPTARPKTYRLGQWTVNVASRNVYRTEDNIPAPHLTIAEFDLLEVFCVNPNTALSRATLLTMLGGSGSTAGDRSIDTLVARLRNKIENNSSGTKHIKTIRGLGYLLDTREAGMPESGSVRKRQI